MNDFEVNELEMAPPEAVQQAARNFAVALSETSQFKAYEEAIARLKGDPQAQQALAALEKKQQDLQALLLLNAISPAEREELERLRVAFLNRPSVTGYYQAQAELQVICQEAADGLSAAIGLNYAAACGSGCC